jgi:glycosyltransferase involved in cell wall biosynthesis
MITIAYTTYNNSSLCLTNINKLLSNDTTNKYISEIIIYDDCSTEPAPKFNNSQFAHLINYYRSKKNHGGPALGRNYALFNSKNNIIIFCDADDEILNNKILAALNYKDVGAVFCNLKYKSRNKTFFKYYKTFFLEHYIFVNNFIPFSGLIVYRDQLKGLTFNEKLTCVDDYEFILKIITHKINYRLHHDIIGYYNDSNDQSISKLKKATFHKELIEISNNHNKLYKRLIKLQAEIKYGN